MSHSQGSDGGAEPSYHELTVAAVREETAEANSFVLVPEPADASLFQYRAGQFLSFRVPHQAGPIIRSYSLSSAPCSDSDMTVCVKRVAEGRGSNWFNDQLTAGMRIEATRPSGRFVLRESDAPLLLIAGGSGITPCISLVKHALMETGRRVKLVYANQSAASVIYRDVLDTLESRFSDRFSCQHWLDERSGFLTAADIVETAKGWEQAECYICGPDPLMNLAEETLGELLGEDATILTERFASPDDAAPRPTAASGFDSTSESTSSEDAVVESFRLTLDSEEHSVPIAAGETLLQAALTAGIDAPFSCAEGRCSTCMGQLRSGEVSMTATRGLSKRKRERGYILACQARPASAAPIWLDFDI